MKKRLSFDGESFAILGVAIALLFIIAGRNPEMILKGFAERIKGRVIEKLRDFGQG